MLIATLGRVLVDEDHQFADTHTSPQTGHACQLGLRIMWTQGVIEPKLGLINVIAQCSNDRKPK